jgi:sensor histidine kinase regulating citrate/malate metabolism
MNSTFSTENVMIIRKQKEIIERMGGDISVASTLGKGSTFTVSIPIQP